MGVKCSFAIVLDRPLAEAKALVDDPAAFTREMTRILRDKQTHPLIAQMMKPAASSDPPPDAAAASGASSSGEPRAASHEQYSSEATSSDAESPQIIIHAFSV